MKKRRKIISTIVQIVAVLVFTFSYVSYNNANNRPVNVVGFSRTVDAGVKISDKDLKAIPVSPSTLNENMILASEFTSIVGKYTTTKVFNGSIAYKEQFGDVNITDSFNSMDLSNSRVISLPIDLVEAFAGDVQRGDRIDLLFKGKGNVLDPITGEVSEFNYAKIFMQNIPVFQVNTGTGYRFISRAHVVPGEKYQDENESVADMGGDIASISLVVTPEQAEQIEARRLTGDIKFVKRFEESETHETLGFVIGNYGKIFSGNANAETSTMQIIENFNEEIETEEEIIDVQSESSIE